MIPLFNIKGHELTSLNGEVSHFYEITPPDMEGISKEAKQNIYFELERDLINTDGIFKVYFLDGKVYLNAFQKIELTSGKLTPCSDPLGILFKSSNPNVRFYENYLTIGSEFVRVLSFVDYPSTLYETQVLAWPPFVISFWKISKLKAKKRINFKRKLHFSSLFKGMRDLESENAFNQSENLLNEITTDDKALFQVEGFLILKAESKSELDLLTERTLFEFKGLGAELLIEERGLSYFFQSIIPGVPTSFKRGIDFPSDYLSYMIPYHQDALHESGMKLTSRSGNPLFFDLFNPQALNFNMLITGTSGQGKSMIANKLLMFEESRGTKAVILDLGNSFYKNARFHGGVVLSEQFNPLQFKNPRYLKEFILSCVDEKLSKKEEGRLYEAIKEIMAQKTPATFGELLGFLEEGFNGISFYFKEIEEFFSNESRELNDLTYCDFSNYPDAMKAPLIIYLIEYFKNLQGRKLFIFDECWNLLSNHADYLAECFRTFRKMNASAVAISQNLDDFSRTQLGRVIIQNTYFKFLFKQSLNESEFLDSFGVELLESIQSKKGEYSEFLYLSENYKKPVRFYSTPLEYNLFTSDRLDNNRFDSYMNEAGRFLEFKDAITNFTKIKNPDWRDYETTSSTASSTASIYED